MTIILSTILPVAFVIILGFIVGKKFEWDQGTLAQLSVYILAPALVFDSLYRTNVSWKNTFQILLGYTFICLLLYFFVLILCRLTNTKKTDLQSILAITLCPNNGNMGLPIAKFAFGNEGLEKAIIYMIGSSIFLFVIAPAMLKNKGFLFGLKLIFKLPLIWAMLAGITLNLLNIELPFKIGDSIEMLGISSIPIALLILGMQLANNGLEVKTAELPSILIKLIIAPIFAYAVGKSLNLESLDLQILIIQTAMPTAVNSLIMVKEFGGNSAMVARAIVLSTVMSFLTLPIILVLIS